MNIDTLLEAAKYVESVAVASVEPSFTRGKDEVDSYRQKDPKPSYPTPILEKQLSCPPSAKHDQTKTPSPQPRYIQQPILAWPSALPPPPPPPPPPPASSQAQHVLTNTSIPASPVSAPASVVQHTAPHPQHPRQHSAIPYHLYTHIPQPLPPPQQQMQQHQHHFTQQHSQLQQQQHHQQQSVAMVTNSVPLTVQGPAHPPAPSAATPPLTSTACSPRLASPQQAINLLKLGESQQTKYATLSAASSPRGGISPSGLAGNRSPRLVHQIVSHDQWVAGERPASPRTLHGFKPSESDSADSANDGSGKDKRAGIREVHNKLEKNRRAQLKECFENLRCVVPNMEDKKSKTSNLSILRGAVKYIQVLKRKERELEHELERLVRQKISTQQRLDLLKIKNGMSTSETVKLPNITDAEDDDDEGDRLVVIEDKDEAVAAERKRQEEDDDQASTSTASEAEEEERKSQAQSRSQSPLHQPVTGHTAHPMYPHLGVSTSYQALGSLQGHKRTTLPAVGTSHSANETMFRISALREVQPISDAVRKRHALEEVKVSHGSGPRTSSLSPRTTYLQMNHDKVSTVLQNVAGHISPVGKQESSVLVSQSANAVVGSISRQTVSQLLGKQPVVRQPVRRQLTVAQMPVIQPPLRASHLFPRIMSTSSVRLGFTPTSQSVIGPSKPVVTVGINSLLAQPSVIQSANSHKTVISNGLVTSASELTTLNLAAKQVSPIPTSTTSMTTSSLTRPLSTSVLSATGGLLPKSLVTASVITQTLPVMSNAGHSPFLSPIALQSPGAAGASLLFTQPAASYIGLPPSMISQPFIAPFPATQSPHMHVTTSTQVTPSSATNQPVVHPAVQPIGALSSSAISLALAQATLPKHLPQMSAASFPGALSINTLPSQSTLSSSQAVAKYKTLANPPLAIASASATQTKSKTLSSTPTSSGSKGSRSMLGRGLNGKTESQITTSKMAETMANLASTAQTMAKNGHSASTINSQTSQQSVVVKL